MSLKKINHSIRDPQGFVFEYEGEVYRCVKAKYSSFFINLLGNSFIKKLNGNSLINTKKIDNFFYKISDEISKNDIILKHKKLPIITKPYEWSFDQLKDAAIFHLNFEQGLLKNGLCLKDASAYNVSFFNNRPVFIDFLSINKYEEGSFWAGYKQFINQFLNPLLLKSLLNLNFHNFYKSDQNGFHTSDLSKLLKLKHYFNYNVFVHVILLNFLSNRKQLKKKYKKNYNLKKYNFLLESLKKFIITLHFKKSYESIWNNYEYNLPYDIKENDLKKDFINNFLNSNKINSLLDLGCNIGKYSFLSENKTGLNVVGVDMDHDCINECYQNSKIKKNNYNFKIYDFYNFFFNNEKIYNFDFDASLSLALIHHLRFTLNVPLKIILEKISILANRGVIEFITKNDEMVKSLLSYRVDTYDDYNFENFKKILKNLNFRIIKTLEIKTSKRILVEIEKI